MKLNKKGFTLVELLAVIVVLGIIALIGYTFVGPIISDSRNSSATNNLLQYEHALELGCGAYQAKEPTASEITVTNAETKASFKGTKPELISGSGEWTFENGSCSFKTRPTKVKSLGVECKYESNEWKCGE